MVILAGALGGTVHAIRSLFWYIGNRELKLSWIPMYLMLPPSGAMIAVIFYLIIRGGFSGKPDESWQGLLAIAAMVGLFSQQAAEKMRQIANTIFTEPPPGKPSDSDPEDSNAIPPAIKVTKIEPPQGPASGGQEIKISGAGFVNGAKVNLGANPATVVKVVEGASITAKTLPSQQTGKVVVEVINPDGKSGKLPDGYTYTSEPTPNDAQQPTGEAAEPAPEAEGTAPPNAGPAEG